MKAGARALLAFKENNTSAIVFLFFVAADMNEYEKSKSTKGILHSLKLVVFVVLQVRPTLLPEAPTVSKNPLKTAGRDKLLLLTNVVQPRRRSDSNSF